MVPLRAGESVFDDERTMGLLECVIVRVRLSLGGQHRQLRSIRYRFVPLTGVESFVSQLRTSQGTLRSKFGLS